MIKNVIDNILIGPLQRFKSAISNIAQDFSFLNPTIIYSWPMKTWKERESTFCNKYENGVNKIKFISELESFKQHVYNIDYNLNRATYFEMLNFI